MKVKELLRGKSGGVVTVGPQTVVSDAVALMSEHNLGAVVVSSDGREIEGILTERDVVRRLVGGVEFLAAPVAEAMTAAVETCTPDASVQQLMTTMTNRRFRHLPVVDGSNALVGIVSIGDVVKSTITELEFERDQLQDYVSH